MSEGRMKRMAASALAYLAIIAITLALLDLACIALGLFPIRHHFGDRTLGWRPAVASGQMSVGKCVEFSTGDTVTFTRNEAGIRTQWARRDIEEHSTSIRIGIVGDSHTDLCAPNEQVHSGVLESRLMAGGIHAIALNYGAGRYSPLQAYLAFQEVLAPFRPQVLVLNVYTGNDFYDMLRSDDRPYLVPKGDSFAVAPPAWYALEDPDHPRKSRVLFAFRELLDKAGVRGVAYRMSELRRLGAEQGAGLPGVLRYMRDLWNAREPTIGYPDALSAQMLNQQLFFARFPGGIVASEQRMEALMVMIRKAHPEMILVMSPLPSYELVGQLPIDSTLLRVLRRLPITLEQGREQERGLYEWLRSAAGAHGWVFVDNLNALRQHDGSARLYNDFDYHLLPPASAIIGHAQAAALSDTLRSLRSGRGAR